jgi:DNA topoisomerase-1
MKIDNKWSQSINTNTLSYIQMYLVVVESPAKCAKIASFLGSDYQVIATMGHIRALKESLDAVGIHNDFTPDYEFMKEKARAINQLKEKAANAQRVYLCSDDDREGEMIAYSVCILLKLDPAKTPRAVFHEITRDAVRKAVANPRLIDMDKMYAQQARAMLDLMVGFTLSKLLWSSVGPGLSAGRCQTPALRLVVEREQEISNFQSAMSWKIQGKWNRLQNSTSTDWDAQMVDMYEDEDSALTLLEIHKGETAKITEAKTTQWSQSPPKPLITSSLQQQASSLYRSNPKNTMKIAQRLYEAGHITYMRTDKAVLGEEATQEAEVYVTENYGESYLKPQTSTKSSKKPQNTAQEAHEAIRPTHFTTEELPEEEDWSDLERKIYKLVWLRATQSVMADCKGEQRTITFSTDPEYPWRSSWRNTTFQGWKVLQTQETQEINEEGDGGNEQDTQQSLWNYVLQLKEGDQLLWSSLQADPSFTKAPSRYNEATLIKMLEEKGIGRPSTFASLISTIQDRTYVETKTFPSSSVQVNKYTLQPAQWPPKKVLTTAKLGGEKDRLTPTALGNSVLTYLIAHFQDIFAYEFTASMEARLDSVAEHKESWKTLLQDTWESYKERYQQLLKDTKETKPNRRDMGDGLIAILTKKGPFLLRESPDGDKEKTTFYGWPQNIGFDALTPDHAQKYVISTTQAQEGTILGIHEGKQIIRNMESLVIILCMMERM